MFGEKLKNARIEKGYKQSELGELLGLKNTTISNWEKGVSNPDVEIVSKLCKILNVPASYFFDDMASKEILSFSEQQVIKKYRNLDDHGVHVVDSILNIEYDRCIKEHENIYTTKMIDKYPRLASAGTGIYLFESIPIEKIEVDEECKADFAVGIYGDSMEPTYHDGETVLVKKQECLSIGEIGIFIADGDSFIKEYGGDRLISHNKKYDDILFNENMDIRIVGKVISIYEE